MRVSFKLLEIFDTFNLIDVWLTLYPSAKQYTYFSPTHCTYTRIDYILALKSLLSSFFSADIGPRSLSDHAWVSCLFSKKLIDSTGQCWNLNSSLLHDAVICEQMETMIKDYFSLNENCRVHQNIVWDAFKAVARSHFISVASACKKTKEQVTSDLKAKIAFLESRHIRFGEKKNTA